MSLFYSNQDSSQVQGLQSERGICETKRSWCVSECPKQDNKRRMNICRHLCFWLLLTLRCLKSHQDWELLEGLVGQKGAWKEGMGRKSHQEVSKHSGIHRVSVKYELNSKHYCCFTSYWQQCSSHGWDLGFLVAPDISAISARPRFWTINEFLQIMMFLFPFTTFNVTKKQ